MFGSNGSGKSTLLRVLAGLLGASEGRVERPPRQDLGYAALDLALYPQLTAAEHLELAARLRGVEPKTGELLDFVGLADSSGVSAAEMSTGMRARLKFGLALQATPSLLILDEPGAALDETGRELLDRIVAVQKVNGALVFASNDPAERRYATHELSLDA